MSFDITLGKGNLQLGVGFSLGLRKLEFLLTLTRIKVTIKAEW